MSELWCLNSYDFCTETRRMFFIHVWELDLKCLHGAWEKQRISEQSRCQEIRRRYTNPESKISRYFLFKKWIASSFRVKLTFSFRLFENVVKYFDAFLNLIPLSFVLGFYVSYVASRKAAHHCQPITIAGFILSSNRIRPTVLKRYCDEKIKG